MEEEGRGGGRGGGEGGVKRGGGGGEGGIKREPGDLVPFLSQLLEGVDKGYWLPGEGGVRGEGGEEGGVKGEGEGEGKEKQNNQNQTDHTTTTTTTTNKGKDSLLHYAVRAQCVDMVMLLVDDEGVKVGERNERGRTVLEEVVEGRDEGKGGEILTLLMGRWEGGGGGEGLMELGLCYSSYLYILIFWFCCCLFFIFFLFTCYFF